MNIYIFNLICYAVGFFLGILTYKKIFMPRFLRNKYGIDLSLAQAMKDQPDEVSAPAGFAVDQPPSLVPDPYPHGVVKTVQVSFDNSHNYNDQKTFDIYDEFTDAIIKSGKSLNMSDGKILAELQLHKISGIRIYTSSDQKMLTKELLYTLFNIPKESYDQWHRQSFSLRTFNFMNLDLDPKFLQDKRIAVDPLDKIEICFFLISKTNA
ncbi:MAG: hypothetical protein V4721_16505 [Bacteroidota bacterium]